MFHLHTKLNFIVFVVGMRSSWRALLYWKLRVLSARHTHKQLLLVDVVAEAGNESLEENRLVDNTAQKKCLYEVCIPVCPRR